MTPGQAAVRRGHGRRRPPRRRVRRGGRRVRRPTWAPGDSNGPSAAGCLPTSARLGSARVAGLPMRQLVTGYGSRRVTVVTRSIARSKETISPTPVASAWATGRPRRSRAARSRRRRARGTGTAGRLALDEDQRGPAGEPGLSRPWRTACSGMSRRPATWCAHSWQSWAVLRLGRTGSVRPEYRPRSGGGQRNRQPPVGLSGSGSFRLELAERADESRPDLPVDREAREVLWR